MAGADDGDRESVNMPQTFFVTATGTGVGKTFVTTTLVRQLQARGVNVRAVKPIISGYPLLSYQRKLVSSGQEMLDADFRRYDEKMDDCTLILHSLGLEISPENIEKISPWRFAAPLSPDMAARAEDRAISLDEVVEFCLQSSLQAQRSNPEKQDWIATSATPPRNDDNILLIEGVGGVLVPLNETHTVRDWMARLNAKIILVAGTYLGSISHTLTAIEALAARNLRPHALIINESEIPAAPLSEIAQSLANFLPENISIICIPRHNEGEEIPDISGICL